jgi:hypothetical protein
MSARDALPAMADDSLDVHERRARRAALAMLAIEHAPALAPTLDWDTLDAAPAWLAQPTASFDELARRAGAVLCAPAMRLWIDSARLAAARAAVGDVFLRALLARPDVPALPRGPRIDTAADVAAALPSAGAAVLLAALPAALRGVASFVLPTPTLVAIDDATARAVIDRTLDLSKESRA